MAGTCLMKFCCVVIFSMNNNALKFILINSCKTVNMFRALFSVDMIDVDMSYHKNFGVGKS